MESTVIAFRKNQLYLPFIVGGLTVICGFIPTTYGSNELVGLLGIGLMWIGIGLYKYFSGYITIEADSFKINEAPFGKKIYLSEIREVKNFAGDWIIKYAKDKEMYLNPNWVAPDSIAVFESFINRIRAVSV